MKPSTAKAKGAQTESLFVTYLKGVGVPNAERRHLQGALDKGDISGWVQGNGSKSVCCEVKSGAQLSVPKWINELKEEITNSEADTGFIAVRPKGKPNPEDWWAILPMDVFIKLMEEAGYVPTY